MPHPLMVVLFGAGGERKGGPYLNGDGLIGGDLFGRKLLAGYFNLYLEFLAGECAVFPERIVLADPNSVYCTRGYLDHIATVNRGKSDVLANRNSDPSTWGGFVSRFKHVTTGDSIPSAQAVYEEIRRFKCDHPHGQIVFYLSIPYTKNLRVMEQIKHIVTELGCYGDCFVFFEKPAYLDYRVGAKLRGVVIDSGIQVGRAKQVEHFLPSLRIALKRFEEFAYHVPEHNALLNSAAVDEVLLRMIEPVGTEGRQDFPGPNGDSAPHIAAALGVVLGDPRHFTPESEAILQRVERLMPRKDMPDDADDEMLQDNALACYRDLRLKGIYACCRTDHCAPQHVPTGVYIEMHPRSLEGARWDGSTRFTIQHQKCGPNGAKDSLCDQRLAHLYGRQIPTGKCYEISYRLKHDPKIGGPAYWRFVFDGRIPGSQKPYWWWTKSAIDNGKDERDRIYEFSGFNEIPREFVDTYNKVVRSVVLRRMDDFMPLRWQHAVDTIFVGGVARALDATNVCDIDESDYGQRLWFNAGDDVFERPDIRELAFDLTTLVEEPRASYVHVA